MKIKLNIRICLLCGLLLATGLADSTVGYAEQNKADERSSPSASIKEKPAFIKAVLSLMFPHAGAQNHNSGPSATSDASGQPTQRANLAPIMPQQKDSSDSSLPSAWQNASSDMTEAVPVSNAQSKQEAAGTPAPSGNTIAAGNFLDEEGDFRDFNNLVLDEPALPEDEEISQADEDMTEAEKTPPPAIKPVVKEPEKALTIAPVMLQNQESKRIRVMVGSSAGLDLSSVIDVAEIANPDIADVLVHSPQRVVVVGKSVGSTQLILKTQKQYHIFRVLVDPDYSSLKKLINSVAPTANVNIQTLNGKMILMGSASDSDSVKRIENLATTFQGGEVVNQLSVAGVQQTLLRVTVAEVNKKALRTLGINWAIGGSTLSRDFFFSNNLGQINPTMFSSTGLPDVTRGQQLFSVGPTANGPNTNITFGFPRAELQYFLNALRENSLSRTLAEPNLVAISGQTATFLAGGEVPVPVTQGGATAGAITIQYKEFGVRLSFTPTVVGRQIVRIHVMTEVSDAIPDSRQAGGLPVFTFTTRRVESTIECGNGQTFAIAGLLNEQVQSIASKIPSLGDLPVLGALFSSVNYQKSMTELVVLVTPQLIEPLNPDQVPPPPGALMTDPTDYELFALQKLEGTPKPDPRTEHAGTDSAAGTDVTFTPSGSAQLPNLIGPWGMEDPEQKLVGE